MSSAMYLPECDICFDFLTNKEIYSCKNGHSVCHVCFIRLSCCPFCKNQFIYRNFNLEMVVKLLNIDGIGCFKKPLRKKRSGKAFRICPLNKNSCAFDPRSDPVLKELFLCSICNQSFRESIYSCIKCGKGICKLCKIQLVYCKNCDREIPNTKNLKLQAVRSEIQEVLAEHQRHYTFDTPKELKSHLKHFHMNEFFTVMDCEFRYIPDENSWSAQGTQFVLYFMDHFLMFWVKMDGKNGRNENRCWISAVSITGGNFFFEIESSGRKKIIVGNDVKRLRSNTLELFFPEIKKVDTKIVLVISLSGSKC